MSNFQNSFANNIIKNVTVHYGGVTYESSHGTFLLDEKEDELMKFHREFTARESFRDTQNVKPYSGLTGDCKNIKRWK